MPAPIEASKPTSAVALVIPGRDCLRTLAECLRGVVHLRAEGQLAEIIFVDDGCTDGSAGVAADYGARVLKGGGGGPGSARNVGWRATRADFVWFIDADCAAAPDALACLRPQMDDPGVAGIGGTYANLEADSLLARLIHSEIEIRHRGMAADVDYLASFNVLYRRSALEEVGGFDESLVNGPKRPGAEDCELAFRLQDRGYRLRFEKRSVVGHHHPTRIWRYLRTQFWHGFWRARLYCLHPRRIWHDAYIPRRERILAVTALVVALAACWTILPWRIAIVLSLLVAPVAPQMGMAFQLVFLRTRWQPLVFVGLGAMRSIARGLGLLLGIMSIASRPSRVVPEFIQGLAGRSVRPGRRQVISRR